MNKLNKLAAQQLSKNQMNRVTGGVSRKEYCSTLASIISHNYDDWTEQEQGNAVDAYHANCMQDWNS